jgi:creatinine amidohydrolase
MRELSLYRWESLTKGEFDQIDREHAVVLVTASPIEVHGPHLPLGADALEADALGERTVRFLPERHRDRAFVQLPYIYVATDTVPQPGSLYFHPSTTIRVLTDLGRTLAKQGFKHIFVSSFHGGPHHFLAIEKACERVNRRYGTSMVSVFSLMVGRLSAGGSELGDVLGGLPGANREDFDGDTHGGVVETSQLLALHGDWVDPEYTKLPRQTVDTWLASKGQQRPQLKSRDARQFFRMLGSYRATLAFFLENSYSGTPASASAALGEHILDTLARHAADGCTELLDGKISPRDCHSPLWPLRFIFLNPAMIRLFNRILGFRNPIR